MPPYEAIHLENLAWTFGVGLLVVIAIVLARGSRAFTFSFRKRSEVDLEADTHEFGGGVREQNRPLPVLIWLVIIGYFIWALGYTLFSGARGL